MRAVKIGHNVKNKYDCPHKSLEFYQHSEIQGDSGGPLWVTDSSGLAVQIGIVSGGIDCAGGLVEVVLRQFIVVC